MSTNWWVLYPYVGLKITDLDCGFDQPLFKRQHIFSRDALPDLKDYFVRVYNTPEREVEKRLNASDLNLELIGDDFDSFIAIRQSISGNADVRDIARREAQKFSSIVALSTFTSQLGIWYCSLLENLPTPAPINSIAFSDENVRVSRNAQATHHKAIYTHLGSFEYTRNSLRELLLSPSLGFGKLLLGDLEIHKGYRTSLEAAILTLNAAFVEDDLSLQVLGCVTSIECLFVSRSDFSRMMKRLNVVLNRSTLDFLRTEEVFKARHEFVHKGIPVEDDKLVHKALELGLIALIAFANLVPLFEHKEVMFAQLDAISILEAHPVKASTNVSGGVVLMRDRIRETFDLLFSNEYTKNFVIPHDQ